MNLKLNQWYDTGVSKTRFAVECHRCGHKAYTCDTPTAAYRAAVRKGFDLESGLCKVCHLMAGMEVLVTNRSAA